MTKDHIIGAIIWIILFIIVFSAPTKPTKRDKDVDSDNDQTRR